ncbi:MAG TPA: transketolase, partial [Dyadobacter sp.]|nr:transketolase [Dyadobacter sp.]
DNLIAIIDLNGQQIDGPTVKVMNNLDLGKKYEAFGWEVISIEEGNDMTAVVKGLYEAKSRLGHGRPIMILLHTGMGFGVDYMMGTHKWHGTAPNDDQLAVALAQLDETLGDY